MNVQLLTFGFMQPSKRAVGIDVSKDSFMACICSRDQQGKSTFSEVGDFKNEKTGFNQFVKWVRKSGQSLEGVNFLMEATGVYHERLALHLDKLGFEVNVVLPNNAKHYFKSLNIKTKTDKVDARVLSQMAVERTHRKWHAPDHVYRDLRNLTRFYVQLQEQKTAFNNLKHSKEEAADVQAKIIRINKELVAHLDKQIKEVASEIERVCKSNHELWGKISNLLTIKGVGLITIATIVGETLGFNETRSGKQLASYAGYDVIQRESGSSVKGKTRISKKGNRYIRNALYFPAMVCCRFNPQMKENYLRIIQRKESKMVGQVAIQRKLLLLIYTLWKNQSTYDENYNKVAPIALMEATQDSSCKSTS
jgi:transposase